MSKLYSIQETTLTDIGDALRSKYGETHIETITIPYLVTKSPNATGLHTDNANWGSIYMKVDICRVPGASRIELAYSNDIVLSGNEWLYCAPGEYTTSTFPMIDEYALEYTYVDKTTRYLTINGDTFSVFVSKSYTNRSYYIQYTGYDASGNPIEVEGCSYTEKEVEVPNTYSSADVAAAIEGLTKAPEPIVLTGDQSYGCAGTVTNVYIKQFGNTISTKDITNCNSMFYKFVGETIPFEINGNTKGTNTSLEHMFYDCQKLTQIPKMNNIKVSSMIDIFYNCQRLRYLPEDIVNWFDWSYITSNKGGSAGDRSSMFENCYSLRSIPMDFLAPNNATIRNNCSIYYSGFYRCNTLDELIEVPIPYTGIWTSNAFSSMVYYCQRLKNLTFKTNEDGTPLVVQWKSQTIDFSSYVGYTNSASNILDYNSGITADKEVKDDATYQALKNDPDWFTTKIEYSRYNHDSAVATINSLPDTSAYLATAGGTNTIKFRGVSGQNTDGGAINTLTEEEIAVATAKGWTITFV